MPKCLVCYKWVLDEKDIKIKPEDLSLDVTRAKGKISDFDRNAIEEATLIVEHQGGAVDALTYGTSAVKQSLKDVLSRGPGRVYWIADNSAAKADAYVTANVLAAAIHKLGTYDLILCGEGSSDSFNQQAAPRLAALLGLPCVSFVLKLSVEGGTVKATRGLGDSTEVATVKGPVVLSVLGQINHPRIPSLKQVLGAA
jgi:electron transfer flavoprotein beta subunit